jgi:hypothetical protein
MSVGELLEFIEKNKISRKAKIWTQRIEDFYFEKNGWKTKNIKSFEYPDEKDKYIKIWGCVLYKNKDKNNLYLTAHY